MAFTGQSPGWRPSPVAASPGKADQAGPPVFAAGYNFVSYDDVAPFAEDAQTGPTFLWASQTGESRSDASPPP